MTDDLTGRAILASQRLSEFPNPWSRISEIAARVGVKPVVPAVPSIVATGADGKLYDVLEVVSAVLDRIDKSVSDSKSTS
jgi:hypothetical protein